MLNMVFFLSQIRCPNRNTFNVLDIVDIAGVCDDVTIIRVRQLPPNMS